jgi:hypothetical protein
MAAFNTARSRLVLRGAWLPYWLSGRGAEVVFWAGIAKAAGGRMAGAAGVCGRAGVRVRRRGAGAGRACRGECGAGLVEVNLAGGLRVILPGVITRLPSAGRAPLG